MAGPGRCRRIAKPDWREVVPHHLEREPARVVARQAGPMPVERDRVEIEPTHVEAVLEPHSDQGSIPCASIRSRRDVRSDVPFFLGGNLGCEMSTYNLLKCGLLHT